MNYADIAKKGKSSTTQKEGIGSKGKSSEVSQGKSNELASDDKKKKKKKKKDDKEKKESDKLAGTSNKLIVPKRQQQPGTVMGKIANQYRNV